MTKNAACSASLQRDAGWTRRRPRIRPVCVAASRHGERGRCGFAQRAIDCTRRWVRQRCFTTASRAQGLQSRHRERAVSTRETAVCQRAGGRGGVPLGPLALAHNGNIIKAKSCARSWRPRAFAFKPHRFGSHRGAHEKTARKALSRAFRSRCSGSRAAMRSSS